MNSFIPKKDFKVRAEVKLNIGSTVICNDYTLQYNEVYYIKSIRFGKRITRMKMDKYQNGYNDDVKEMTIICPTNEFDKNVDCYSW